MAEQLNILIVPHTHWDREWYQTFQQFRVRLVRTVDRLLALLDRDPHFRYFMLDGQTIVLDDYLEVRPEQEERLQHYIRSGRILVGPWYLQPDEFLVGGEALIRNLQIGLQRAAEFGGGMHVGYVPDCFGHIAQLPQILQGVGIDNAVFWRGVGEEARQSEFYWEAPDGTRVLVIHLADPIGYSNARQLPLHPAEFVTRVELLTSNILPKATTDTLLFMNGSDHLEPQEGLPSVIDAANALLIHLDPERQQMLNRLHQENGRSKQYDGIHLQIGTLPQYIERVHQQQANLDTLSGEMRSSQYAHLLPSVLSTRMWIKQQNNATEHLLQHWVEPLTAWATRLGAPYPEGFVRLAWKYLLQNHPHDSICGCSIDQVHRENSVRFAQCQQIAESVLSQAMQHIVEAVDTRAPFPVAYPNQAPVPIVVFNPGPGPRTERVQTVVQLPGSLHNAVIVDAAGNTMPYHVINRWRQEIGTMPIAREMFATATTLAGVTTPTQLLQMAHGMMMSALGQEEDTQVISRVSLEDYAEPSTHHALQPGVVAIEVMIAPGGRVEVNEQELHSAGQRVLALLDREDVHTFEVTLIDQARETLDFVAADLPACGLKTFWLYPRGLKEHLKTEKSSQSTLITGPRSIENEYYRVEADAQDGTLTVTDKQSGAVFRGQNRFMDGGDVGDLYTYCPPEHDILISGPSEPPEIELIHSGPVRATLRVSGRFALPGACTANRHERSARVTICPIVSEISLGPGLRRIDIHTRIENRVKDHRLRVVFPVLYKVEHVTAEGTFEVRTRPVAQPRPTNIGEWAEEPVNVFPQKRFVAVSNSDTTNSCAVGLGILNRGLPEYEVVQSGPGLVSGESAVAITLLRCVEWLSRGDLATRHGHAGPMEHTPEAQCLGHHEFDYALVPHSGTWDAEDALVLREAQAFNLPVITRAMIAETHEGELSSTASLLEVSPRELVLSSIKRSNDGSGVVVRVYNPLARVVEANIRPGFSFTRVYKANLLEERQEVVQTSDDSSNRSVHLSIRGGGITTLLFDVG
jgi:alpha-mannosidase